MNEPAIYLLEVSTCMLVLGALFYVLFKRDKLFFFNRIYLLLLPIVAMVLPLINYTLNLHSEYNSPAIYYQEQIQASLEVVTFSSEIESFTFQWSWLLLLVYLLGGLFYLVKLIFSLRIFQKFKQGATIEKHDGIDYIYTTEVHNAFSFGKTIVLPQKNMENATYILAHEQFHVKQKHTWDILYYEILTALLWFHPFIYVFKNWLKEQHEFAADAAVIEQYQSKYLYASALVHQSQDVPQVILPFANHFNSLTIQNRLKMIAKKKSIKIAASKTCLLVPTLLVLFLTFSIQLAGLAQNKKQYQAGKIYTSVAENTKEAKEAKMKEIIKDAKVRGKSISKNDIVFIDRAELEEIAASSRGKNTSAGLNNEYTLRWDNQNIVEGGSIQLNPAQKLDLYVEGKKVKLLRNNVRLTFQLTNEHPVEYATETFYMDNGVLDLGITGFKSYSNNQNPVKVEFFNFTYMSNGQKQVCNQRTSFTLKR